MNPFAPQDVKVRILGDGYANIFTKLVAGNSAETLSKAG